MRSLVVAGLALAILVVPSTGAAAAAKSSPCGHPPRTRHTYHWPFKPFGRQHPIRGIVGDPRILAPGQPFGYTSPKLPGAHSFHNGIDIFARPGTPAYPVVSGRVAVAGENKIVVRTDDGRSFQYYHLARGLHLRRGQRAVAQRTVLGRVRVRWGHVHMAEIDGHVLQNPLDPGHLEPYRDWTRPTATALYVDDGPVPSLIDGRALGPRNQLAVAAADPQPMGVPGPWLGLPQVPALVEWRLFHAGKRTPWQIAADFRRTEPPPRAFWNVYGPGTYQNAPVFANHLFQGTPGRYLFLIHLQRNLRPGLYQLAVRVSDVCRNGSSTTWPLQIAR